MMTKASTILKSVIAVFLIASISACSSGSSSSLKSINLTGTWFGTIQDTPDLAFDVRVVILQQSSFSPITNTTGTSESVTVNYSVTFTGSSDATRTDCAETINNLTATLTLNSDSALLSSEEITALVTNSSISGQAVFSDTCGGPINLIRG